MKNNYPSTFNYRSIYKRITLFGLLLFLSLSLVAQNKRDYESSRITSQVYLEQLLQQKSSAEYVITGEHTSKLSGVKHTYVRQAINGIEVCGTESSLHSDTAGRTIMAHVNFVANIASSVKNASAGITAEQAITSVAQQMGYSVSNLQIKESLVGPTQKGLFNGAGISGTDIPVRLMYYYRDGIGTHLVWELSVMEKDSPDWWNFRVDASSGTIIDKDNWTASCNVMGDHSEEGHKAMAENKANKITQVKTALPVYTVALENSAMVQSYNVFALPKEDPYDGPRTLEVNPANATASPLGWHDDGTTSYTYTKGNNVAAYDDGNNDDTATLADHTPESATGLIFNYAFDATEPGGDPIYSAAAQSEDAAISNLFYWNNIIHDVLYQYGFDEAAGNFQENNFANGGAGGDSVDAQAQDSANLAPTNFNRCNANFGTPADGGNPKMQMYICDGALTADHNDGDFDNNVIIHEYAHGISNRLVGGPGNAGALGNAEQMGEGWSDFYGYMLTMDPLNPTGDRAIGNFLFDLGPAGGGIRNAPYSTSLTTNPWTYAGVADTGQISSPHGIGFIWASMLYEMAQALIAQDGFDADLYNGTGGNNMAIRLVTEGLKLTPPSPGFVDGRNAILAADLALNGGANHCLIWTAFAKRGLGFSASQGLSSSRTDGVEAFDIPVAALAPSRSDICIGEGVVAGLTGGTLAGGVYSGANVTDGGDGLTFSFDAGAAGVGMHSVTYTDPCTATVAMATITVTDGNPVLVCQNATVTLDGAGNASIIPLDIVMNMVAPDGSSGYTVDETGAYNALDISGGTVVNLADDAGSAAIPLGFTFNFFGIGYTNLYISSNGYITFEIDDLTDFSADFLPSAVIPDAIIALAWDDLNPASGTAGTIRYQVTGTAPNRIMVVEYFNVPHFGNASLLMNLQAQLYEGSNRIEIHSNRVDSDGGNRTQGIENEDGTIAYTAAGRNQSNWNIPAGGNAYVAFNPIGGNLPDNCANPVSVSLSQSNFTCKDIGDVIVTVTADDGNGGISTCDATVTVVGPTSTFAAGAWDVTPTISRKAIINDPYFTSSSGSIDACSCELNSSLVDVEAGDYIKVEGRIVLNPGSFLLVANEGSIVQVDDNAVVANNGMISVLKTTPTMAAKSFMISGSPMSMETREGVFGTGYIVRHHLTANFDPHPLVEAISPGINNWADGTGNNWLTHTGLVNPGEGYLVFPQPDGASSGSFTQTHTLGTLTNGVVNFTMGFNANQNSSPSMLSNPYASAIDAELFFDDPANSGIDVVYFWEHLTGAMVGYPGYAAANFSMGDISLYSESLGAGVAAANGGAVPTQFIASGQGFGVKPTAGGTAQFNNAMRVTGPNDTYRTNDIVVRDRLWLKVYNDTYGLGSTSLIGFTETTSDGFINSEDVYRLPTPVSLYSELETGEELVVNALDAFETSDIIFLSFTTQVKETQNYRISIDNLDGVNMEAASVYLIDELTGSVTNLTEGDYTFQSGEAIYHKRFKVVFEYSALGINDSTLDSVSIYPNPTQHSITIVSPQTIVTSATVYDVRGRKVSEVDFRNQTNYQIDMSKLESALYFVEIKTESGSIHKRILKK